MRFAVGKGVAQLQPLPRNLALSTRRARCFLGRLARIQTAAPALDWAGIWPLTEK